MEKRTPFRITQAVIFALVLREAKGRFSVNRLGAFWVIFEPLIHVLAVMFILTIVRGRHLPGMEFPVFLISGVVPFLLFKNIALRGMEAVNANRGLFSYRQIKPFDAIIARAIVEFSLMISVYGIVLFGLGFWGGFDVAIHEPLHWIGIFLIGLGFSIGLALIFCVIAEAMPESRTFIRLLFMPMYIISGVIMPIWVFPPKLLNWVTWNPFLHIIDLLREAQFQHYPDTPQISFSFAIGISIATMFVGMFLYRVRRLKLVAL